MGENDNLSAGFEKNPQKRAAVGLIWKQAAVDALSRELNLPLTASEAAVVEMALKRMRGDITVYINLAEQQRVPIEDLQIKHYIGMINEILDKIERMADGKN